MLRPFRPVHELRRQVLADEEANDRHVRLGNADGTELRVLGPAVDLDRAVEGERRIRIQARGLERLVGKIGTVGRERHVGETAAVTSAIRGARR